MLDVSLPIFAIPLGPSAPFYLIAMFLSRRTVELVSNPLSFDPSTPRAKGACAMCIDQGVAKRCRPSWLTTSALAQVRGEEGVSQ